MTEAREHLVATTPASRCLGWCCTWRDHCAKHVVDADFVLQRWFLPCYTAEHCEWYEYAPIARDDE